MLATPELIAAAAQFGRLEEALPRYRQQAPLYGQPEGGAAPLVLPPGGRWQRLPLITKQDIRQDFPRNFLGSAQALEDLLDREAIELEHTSGTSEERTPLLLPLGWWAKQERHALDLNALVAEVLSGDETARRVTISSPVCSGDICYTGVPSRTDRIVGNALHLSLSRFPFLWGEAELDRMVSEAREWAPSFLDVDPVYGVVFALHCERRGVRLPSLRFIVCSYEFLSVVHRRILQRVFQVPVFNLYGSTETGHLLMEDEKGQMRPSLETAYLEIINTDPAGVGDLVVTTLTNDFMPLIRYRIGDLVEAKTRAYATRYTVHGRAADTFTAPDGRRVTTHHVDHYFAVVPGIVHYQLVEREPGPWSLRYVPEEHGPSKSDVDGLRAALSGLLGLAQPLEVRSTDMLVPETSGKFRLGYPRRTKA